METVSFTSIAQIVAKIPRLMYANVELLAPIVIDGSEMNLNDISNVIRN